MALGLWCAMLSFSVAPSGQPCATFLGAPLHAGDIFSSKWLYYIFGTVISLVKCPPGFFKDGSVLLFQSKWIPTMALWLRINDHTRKAKTGARFRNAPEDEEHRDSPISV